MSTSWTLPLHGVPCESCGHPADLLVVTARGRTVEHSANGVTPARRCGIRNPPAPEVLPSEPPPRRTIKPRRACTRCTRCGRFVAINVDGTYHRHATRRNARDRCDASGMRAKGFAAREGGPLPADEVRRLRRAVKAVAS